MRPLFLIAIFCVTHFSHFVHAEQFPGPDIPLIAAYCVPVTQDAIGWVEETIREYREGKRKLPPDIQRAQELKEAIQNLPQELDKLNNNSSRLRAYLLPKEARANNLAIG